MILITGATDGIGLETARQLAQQGHELVLHGRNEEKVQRARTEILRGAPAAVLHTAHADLADLKAVSLMATVLLTKLPRLDVLINNAGVYMTQYRESAYGVEMTLAVNHLAHFLLTRLMLPLLKKSADPRVVTVSSMVHSSGKIDLTDMNGAALFDAYQAYANSKLANKLFAEELARREPWLASNSLHPGVINTKLLHAAFSMTGNEVSQGALTSVYLASSPQIKNITGKYFDRCTPAPTGKASDPLLARQLWAWSENLLQEHAG
jgi:NAD(P)-dependent dehydrogenase (short-subunit alcohol dehydrogenase family)